MSVQINHEDKTYTFKCPHCDQVIQVLISDTNCCIFRHGVRKDNLLQIPPHTSKSLCMEMIEKNLIYGCGKPFKLYLTELKVKICDYV
jgi:hypothetical protein